MLPAYSEGYNRSDYIEITGYLLRTIFNNRLTKEISCLKQKLNLFFAPVVSC